MPYRVPCRCSEADVPPEQEGETIPINVRLVARILALMLALLALLHGYWATVGRDSLRIVMDSAEVPAPPPWSVWLVVALLVVGVLLILGRVGDWGDFVPQWMFSVGCWTMVVSFSLAALINFFDGTTTIERTVFGPLALLLALGTLLVSLSPKRARQR
ncbi:MAG: DUF3995 domain-containing protein [Propionibacteriales bacterium]|nr:DUF3995 domain-containing protein [Propionibacteriales bacterium]